MTHIKPLGLRVLVEVNVAPAQSGLILTSEKTTPTEGIAVAVGQDVTLVRVGDIVGWGEGFTGQPIQSDAKDYIQILEDDLEYVKEGASA